MSEIEKKEVVPGKDNEEIECLLRQFKTDTQAIKSYTGKLMNYIFQHELKNIDDLLDDFRNLIRNNFLEDSDETYEFRDGIVSFLTNIKVEIDELSQFRDEYTYDETYTREYKDIFIEDFVIASNILNLDLESIFDDSKDLLLIKCTSIIAHKLYKHDDVMKKLKNMNYHSSFEKQVVNHDEKAKNAPAITTKKTII